MLQWPFGCLAALLVATTLFPICLPLAVIVGYPALIIIGLTSLLRWFNGELSRPGQTASLWAIYLGFVLTLHGITICFDTALAGQPPTAEQKHFGNGLAYLGATMTGASAVVAYVLDPDRRLARRGKMRSGSVDDPAA